ncbi:MAG: hypothetical protein RLZZ584_4535, partial [Pseudomonadota bacterium]
MITLPLGVARRWAQAARAFNQRAPRERVLLITASAALLVWLIDLTWLDGRWEHLQRQRRQAAVAAQAVASLQAATEHLHATEQGRLQQARADLAALTRQLAAASLGGVPSGPAGASAASATAASARPGSAPAPVALPGLVPPQQMLPLLQELLVRQRSLQLRSLQSLGQTALGEAGAAASDTAARAAARGSGTTTLYRHAVELTVQGSYADLLAYLQALEALPQ